MLTYIVPLALIALLAIQQYLHNRQTDQWMRIFSERLGISPDIMAPRDRQETKMPVPATARQRERVSVPIPMGALGNIPTKR